MYKYLNCDNKILVIYADYEKIFDSVDHDILLEKVYRMGVRAKVIKLLRLYIANRTQRLRVNGSFSLEVLVGSGVQQGSILASLLFVSYSRNQPKNCKTCKPLLCTDDAKICFPTKSLTCISRYTYHLIEEDRNKLPQDIRKCSLLDFGSSEKIFSFSGNVMKKQVVQIIWVCWSLMTSNGLMI